MDASRFNEVSAHVALGVLGLAAAMFALAWTIDRRRADGIFAVQAVGSILAFPCYTMGLWAGFGRWEIPIVLVLSGLTAVGAVEFTRVHLGRVAPPRLVRASLPIAIAVVIGAALAEVPWLAVIAMLVVSYLCIIYALVAHWPLLGSGEASRNAYVLLSAWAIVGLASGPRSMAFLGMPIAMVGGVDPLAAGSAVFAGLHAFVLVAERARALREARALGERMTIRLATIERQGRELEALDTEVRRQVRQRADDLAHGASRLLTAIRARGGEPAPITGAVIDGRYLLEEELGRGGMGVVHAARRLVDGSRVALKLLRGHPDAIALARFAREARLAAQVRHPNVVQVHDLGLTDDGLIFLVQELVAGPVLKRWSAGRPSPDRVLVVAGGIAEGLAAIHELGIIHRDLKPSNVLLTPDEHPKIGDFGIAALANLEELIATGTVGTGSPDTGREPLTATDLAVGTPMYMAPELIRAGTEPSPAADVYAFGLVVFELMVGRHPFGEPPAHARIELDRDQCAALRTIAGPEISMLIAQCLNLEAARRPTASAVAVVLAAATEALPRSRPRPR